jgi:hypothetical protein
MQFELQIMRFFSHRASSHARYDFSEKGRRFETQPVQREVRKKKSGKVVGHAPKAQDDAGMDIELAPPINSLTTR